MYSASDIDEIIEFLEDISTPNARYQAFKTGLRTLLNRNLEPASSTGTAIKFDRIRTYGKTTPETGNFTLDLDGFKEGVTQLIRHNHSVAPTGLNTGVFKTISGTYVTSQLNFIMLTSVSSNEILVTISQQQA
jgi:hypothetical protein